MSKGIRIINDKERLVQGDFDTDGYEIYYRRIPTHIRSDIARRHTKTGRRNVQTTDWMTAAMDMLKYAITGWRGVFDIIDGKEADIECTPESIEWLPDEIAQDILDSSGANIARDGGDIKNLKPTRVNKSATTD